MTDLEFRLRNWGRVVRLYAYEPRGRCYSMEGGYRSPQHWWPEDPKAAPADVLDAWRVESAICVLRTRSQTVLRGRYVFRWKEAALARKFCPSKYPEWALRTWSDVEAAIVGAKIELQEATLLPAAIRRVRAVEFARKVLGPIPVDVPNETSYRALKFA